MGWRERYGADGTDEVLPEPAPTPDGAGTGTPGA